MSYTPKSDLPAYLTASGLAHPDTWDAATQTYNITATSFKNFRVNLAKSMGGLQKCNIYSDGDSITSGAAIVGPPETNSYTAKARILMNTSGRWGSIVEPGPITLDDIYPAYGPTDSRLTLSGTGSSGLGNFGVAGAGYAGGTSGTWSITFGPVTCDTFEVYDRIAGLPSPSGWNWSVDGGSSTFVPQQSTGGDVNGNRKTVISAGSVGSHTLTITAPTAGAYGILTGITYKTAAATSGVVWAKRGVGGTAALTTGTSAGWNNTQSTSLCYTGQSANTHPAPHLVILQLGTNPEAGNSASAFKTNMGTLITTIQSAGADVLLCVAPPGGSGVSGTQATYLAAVAPVCYQLADQFNIGLFDMFWRWGGSNAATIDTTFQGVGSSGHPSTSGHADMGFGLYNALVKVA